MSQHTASVVSSPTASPITNTSKSPRTLLIVCLLAIGGVIFAGINVFQDVALSGDRFTSFLSFSLLGLALVIALGFEFVNGFHDTANAVATVIYTRSMSPTIAVVWSGLCNFAGVLLSSGMVAFGIISLLPVDLILQASSGHGFAMIFALLCSAIIWNLGTWYFGLPSSSSHTMIGSIIGVGVAYAIQAGQNGWSGVNWVQVSSVFTALLVSPLVGFFLSAFLLLLLKRTVQNPKLFRAPSANSAPPLWVRSLLIITCSGVSFAHGSNDGQKGMGLIMLILVGTMPIAYSLNRSMPINEVPRVAALAQVTGQQLIPSNAPILAPALARDQLKTFIRIPSAAHTQQVLPALGTVLMEISRELTLYGTMDKIPAHLVPNVRNDMYLASEAISAFKRTHSDLSASIKPNLAAMKTELDHATRFIPMWVKIVVALALGLGTMVGWKRIVVTVGERIGKTHLTYAQGASAEAIAMATIGAADLFGLPVSTTHVLSSGVAGTMAANGGGLQKTTLRNMIMAWVLTLPASILLSALLFTLFSHC
ncbi:inorganic phosphate transporter [Rosenbergiella australiborealis]|uniref:Phosphate transporter n=1 Tax=Rosenbergiella australiborealis TaxID=1544696 RepID=A0ABS5T633_9GAMM|nr:inorganic phosphate transporter [Rosenbergiella australiborealis]MBT0727804.1 inorganic phosphate transporter [Rosenbergiella australiborealis]